MADEVDIANEMAERELQLRLAEQKSKLKTGFGPEECEECGEEMPTLRRQMGFQKCVSCAQQQELRRKTVGF